MVVNKDGDGFNDNAPCTNYPGVPYFTTDLQTDLLNNSQFS